MTRWLLAGGLVLGALLALPCHAWAEETLLSVGQVHGVKGVVAGVGTLWLLLHLVASRFPGLPPRFWRLWDGGLLVLGVAAVVCWTNIFQFHYPHFGHRTETYHYYMGSKYFPELGYTRLYQCTTVADAEVGGPEWAANRYIRNLETNSLESGQSVLADPEACKRHFSPARWRSFRRDLNELRKQSTEAYWLRMQQDHGYNATPVWGFFGSILARTGPASGAQILALQLVDLPLLALAWSAVGWTFGWRPLCVALLYWGTNFPAEFSWIGGSPLRQIELTAVLVALCLLRRERELAAGFLLGLAVLVRIYPIFLLAGPGLAALAAMVRERRVFLARAHRRLVLGGLLSVATLVPLSALTSGGLDAWKGFAENSRLHLDKQTVNRMGLHAVLSYDHANRLVAAEQAFVGDPYDPWQRAREETFARRRPLFVARVAGFVLLLAGSVRKQPAWAAVVLGTGLVIVAGNLSNYYSAILVLYALLWRRHPPVGVALCALSTVGCIIADRFLFQDEVYFWIGLASIGFVVLATAWAWRGSAMQNGAPQDEKPGGQPAR
jgi:hypothetical protein